MFSLSHLLAALWRALPTNPIAATLPGPVRTSRTPRAKAQAKALKRRRKAFAAARVARRANRV